MSECLKWMTEVCVCPTCEENRGANKSALSGGVMPDTEKALDEFVGWCNKQGVSFEATATFDKECPTLAKLLGLNAEK